MPTVPAEAVYAALRELAGGDRECSPTVAQIAELAELGRTRTKAALAELEAEGRLERTHHADGVTPVAYRLVTPVATPLVTPVATADVTPVALVRERDTPEPSLRARSAGNGNRSRAAERPPTSAGAPPRARLAAPQPTEPAVPTEPDPNPAGAAIAAAVAECSRQGKPDLDEAAKRRIGSVAKRMHKGGVGIAEIQAAAMYLAAHGMSDLQAAHRASLEQQAEAAGDADLAERAAASFAARAEDRARPRIELAYHPITIDELAEVWHLLSVLWPRVALPPAEHAPAWVAELKPCPVDSVLAACRQWSRRTDGQGGWPPNVGQLRTRARLLYGDELTIQHANRAVAEQQRILRGEAKGDGTDPRAYGA